MKNINRTRNKWSTVDAPMPGIRTPDIRTFRKTVLVSTILFIPVTRTYFAIPKGVLIILYPVSTALNSA